MTWSDLPLKPSPRVLRQFAAAWLLFFLAMAAYQGLRLGHPTAARWLGVIALTGLVGLWKPPWIRWLFVAATVAAFPIGWLVTQTALALMFFLMLAPLALVFRWRGRDELRLRPRPGQTGYWVERGTPPEPGRYLKQY
jgi:hypothetical protein